MLQERLEEIKAKGYQPVKPSKARIRHKHNRAEYMSRVCGMPPRAIYRAVEYANAVNTLAYEFNFDIRCILDAKRKLAHRNVVDLARAVSTDYWECFLGLGDAIVNNDTTRIKDYAERARLILSNQGNFVMVDPQSGLDVAPTPRESHRLTGIS